MKSHRFNLLGRALALGLLGLFALDPAPLWAQPAVIRGPTNFWHSVSVGATVKNQVWLSGGTPPYTYRWRFKGDPIPWATNSSITLTNVQTADAGPYDVVVTDAASASVTSDTDELKVNPMFEKITAGSVVTDLEPSNGGLWVDLDDDDDLDLLVSNGSASWEFYPPSMYRNEGDGSFTKVSNSVTARTALGIGIVAGDFDNDGRVDLYAPGGSSGSRNKLYRNLGEGNWEQLLDQPFGRRITGAYVASWVDYDRDGFIDLFNQVNGNDELYRSLGDGTFRQVPFSECGLGNDNADAVVHAWSDYDRNGWPDVFLAGNHGLDISSSGLYRNDGQGRFERVQANIVLPAGTTVVALPAWADYDSDGWPDLHIRVHLPGRSGWSLLFRNRGDGTFTDVTSASGLPQDVGYNRLAWGDYDNDGFLDLLMVQNGSANPASVALHNRGDGTFESVDLGSPLGESATSGQTPSWADYDNDGFLDLLRSNGKSTPNGESTPERNYLYHNGRRHADNTENTNHWLKVKLVGRVSNRTAIGAKVIAETIVRGRLLRQLREISGNDVWASPPGPVHLAHFGLGDATNVTTLRVEWPSGNVQELTDVTPDRTLPLIEPPFITPPRPSASLNGSARLTRVWAADATYQWRFDGAELAGQTNRILNLANLTADQEGRYSVVVSNASALVTNYVYLDVDTNFTVITEGPLVTDLGAGALGGVADIDNDGDLDVSVGRTLGANAVYYNNGDGTFTGVTTLPFAQPGDCLDGWADLDNDGRLDPLVLTAPRPHMAFCFDNGDGTFTRRDMTAELPALADYDRDGLLDFFSTLGMFNRADVLCRNNGDRTFTTMTASMVGPLLNLSTWGVARWGDFDDDGWSDIYVPNFAGGGNYMFRNDGTGRFVAMNNLVTRTGGSAYAGPIGGAWADYDNDGRLDLCVASLKGGRTAVYRNLGNGEFESPSGTPNLPGKHNFVSWADYDNDGFLDLFLSGAYQTNQLFRGHSDGTFTEVTTGSIVRDRPPGSVTSYYSALWFDYDNDGFLDLYVMNADDNNTLYTSQFLYHNNGNANGWLKVRLIGTASNRDAVGAKVRALAPYAGAPRWQRRDITSGEVLNGGHLYAHFGLGNATNVTTLHIKWPSGAEQELLNLTTNQFLTIWEPPALSAAVLAGGACELTVKAEPNRGWQIKASTDLVDWQTLTTVTNATVAFQYTDASAATMPYRFYRVDPSE